MWKEIDGYEGLYEVSTCGEVRSLDRIGIIGRKIKGRILKSSEPQPQVALSYLGVKEKKLISRLVAGAFIKKLNDGDMVCHKDGNKQNNAADNLYVTKSRIELLNNTKKHYGVSGCELDQKKITSKMASDTFEYLDGKLIYKKRTAFKVFIGDEAGSSKEGTAMVKLGGIAVSRCRIVWLMHNGRMPEYIIHIDGNNMNDRIENLKEVSASELAIINDRIENLR